MLRDIESTPSFPEPGFNSGLDGAQMSKNSELLERFGKDRDIYTSIKELVAIADGNFFKGKVVVLYHLSSLRACGVDLIPEIDDFFMIDFEGTEWPKIVSFLMNNRDALLKGTYKNDGKLVESGKILGEEKDVLHEEKIGPYVRKVMPGVNMIAGTYPRLHMRLGYMITGADGIDDEGVKIVAKGFEFIRDKFLPKLEEALQHFLSSRSEAIFAKMISVRKGFDKVLGQKDKADRLLGRPVGSHENIPVPEHWIDEYKNFMHQINLMYAVYDKLESVVFRLSAVADGGAHVEASKGSDLDFERDLYDYMTDAKLLMGEMTEIISMYMKALMHSGINETHPDDVMEIEEFLK